jgi:hypothetical protein
MLDRQNLFVSIDCLQCLYLNRALGTVSRGSELHGSAASLLGESGIFLDDVSGETLTIFRSL